MNSRRGTSPALVRARAHAVTAMLDLGTGGGEFLSDLVPLPPRTTATDAYPLNVPVARDRLAPLGVEVVDTSRYEEDELPFADGSFGLVVSRHESYRADEVGRVLRPGGWFLTQQVGGRDLEQLNAALGAPPVSRPDWCLSKARADLERVGFEVVHGQEEQLPGWFHDIGAVVLFLRFVPWQIPDFDLGRYGSRLRTMHDQIAGGGPLRVTCHRFLVAARRP